MTDDYDYLTNAASATEFTGLIPSLPQNDAELEAYNDICRFLPPSASDQKNLSDQTHLIIACNSTKPVIYYNFSLFLCPLNVIIGLL